MAKQVEHRDEFYLWIEEHLGGKCTLLSAASLSKFLNIGIQRSARYLSRLAFSELFRVDKVGEKLYIFTDKSMTELLERSRLDKLAQARKIKKRWARFNMWSQKFEDHCLKTVELDYWSFEDVAFANASCHVIVDLLLRQLNGGQAFWDDKCLQSGVSHAVRNKIDFFKHYLLDALHENKTDVKNEFEFLKQQQPSKIKKNMSFWFGKNIEAGRISNSSFSPNSIMLFNPSAYSMDFQRVRDVLAYDRICIRNKQGAVWSDDKIKKVVKKISADICLPQKRFEVSIDTDSNVLTVNLDKNFPLHVVY